MLSTGVFSHWLQSKKHVEVKKLDLPVLNKDMQNNHGIAFPKASRFLTLSPLPPTTFFSFSLLSLSLYSFSSSCDYPSRLKSTGLGDVTLACQRASSTS
jgi:hypothetical protein